MKGRTYLRAAAVAALAICLAEAGQAATIADGSFEGGPPAGSGQRVSIGSNIGAWTVVSGAPDMSNTGRDIAWLGNGAFGLSSPFGTDFLDMTGFDDATPYDGVTQTIATTVGQAYSLNFYLGASTTDGRYLGPVSVEAVAGTTSALFTYAGDVGTVSGSNVWGLQTLNFVATESTTAISLFGVASAGGQFIGLDNVSIVDGPATGGVPEPASWAMMIAGFGLVGATARRRSGRMVHPI